MTTRIALVEIDLQGWIIDASESAGVPERARAVRDTLRSEGVSVFCTRYLSRDPGDPLRSNIDGPGVAFHELCAPEPGDVVLTKYGQDVTENPDLHTNLQLAGVTDVVLTGIATGYGVAKAAVSLRDLGYRVSVVGDACAGFTRDSHAEALTSLAADGIHVCTADSLP